MQIQYGPVIENASGSIGNVTASKNKAGAYMRVRSIPLNPQTEFQMAQRNIMTALSQGWALLSESQRAGWTNLGKSVKEKDPFGNAREISGIAAFIRSNAPLLHVGLTALTSAPSDHTVQNCPLDWDNADLSLDGPDILDFGNITLGGNMVTVPRHYMMVKLSKPLKYAGQQSGKALTNWGFDEITTPNPNVQTNNPTDLIVGQTVNLMWYFMNSANGFFTHGEVKAVPVKAA